MENVRPEGTDNQSVISPSAEALDRDFLIRRSERIIKSPQPYDPGVGPDI